MRKTMRWAACGAAVLSFAAVGGSRARAGYTFTTIDVPGPGVTNTYGQGLNSAGDLVGYFADGSGTHGFLATPLRSVPEPSSIVLVAFGSLFGLGVVRRRG